MEIKGSKTSGSLSKDGGMAFFILKFIIIYIFLTWRYLLNNLLENTLVPPALPSQMATFCAPEIPLQRS